MNPHLDDLFDINVPPCPLVIDPTWETVIHIKSCPLPSFGEESPVSPFCYQVSPLVKSLSCHCHPLVSSVPICSSILSHIHWAGSFVSINLSQWLSCDSAISPLAYCLISLILVVFSSVSFTCIRDFLKRRSRCYSGHREDRRPHQHHLEDHLEESPSFLPISNHPSADLGNYTVRYPVYSVQQIIPLGVMESSGKSSSGKKFYHTIINNSNLNGWPNQNVMAQEKRMGHVSVCYNGKLVVWGGYNDEKFRTSFSTNEVKVYDPLVQTWYTIPISEQNFGGMLSQPNKGTSGATSRVIGHHMYIFGGYRETDNTNDLCRIYLRPLQVKEPEELMDTRFPPYLRVEKIQFFPHSPKPLACDKNVSWVHDGKFYVFGGYGPQVSQEMRSNYQPQFQFKHDTTGWAYVNRGWNNLLSCFDPATCTWSFPQVSGEWPVPRAAHAAACLGNKVYVFGGRHDENRLNDLWELDLKKMTWKQIFTKTVLTGRSWHSLTQISDTEILLYGGLSNSRIPLSDCWVLDTRNDNYVWIPVMVRSQPRLWHCAVYSPQDQQVIIYGGGNEDILNQSIPVPEKKPMNNLIIIRFSPDSLLRLSLNTMVKYKEVTDHSWNELPSNLRKVLQIRILQSFPYYNK